MTDTAKTTEESSALKWPKDVEVWWQPRLVVALKPDEAKPPQDDVPDGYRLETDVEFRARIKMEAAND